MSCFVAFAANGKGTAGIELFARRGRGAEHSPECRPEQESPNSNHQPPTPLSYLRSCRPERGNFTCMSRKRQARASTQNLAIIGAHRKVSHAEKCHTPQGAERQCVSDSLGYPARAAKLETRRPRADAHGNVY